jgi:hypothetical protein
MMTYCPHCEEYHKAEWYICNYDKRKGQDTCKVFDYKCGRWYTNDPFTAHKKNVRKDNE